MAFTRITLCLTFFIYHYHYQISKRESYWWNFANSDESHDVAASTVVVRQSADRHDSGILFWSSIDRSVRPHDPANELADCFCSFLPNNQLTGTLSTSLGRLSLLKALSVIFTHIQCHFLLLALSHTAICMRTVSAGFSPPKSDCCKNCAICELQATHFDLRSIDFSPVLPTQIDSVASFRPNSDDCRPSR
jgi:hypothetical protein